MEKIGFIGAGSMAEALIKGITDAKLCKPENIFVSDIDGQRLEYLTKNYSVRTILLLMRPRCHLLSKRTQYYQR